MDGKLTIAFIGAGRLACQLAPTLSDVGFRVAQVISKEGRDAEKLGALVGAVSNDRISALDPDIDLVMLTVPDRELDTIYQDLSHYRGFLVHTSGTFPLRPMTNDKDRCGVLYPLQTFSNNRPLDWKRIPLFIEATDLHTESLLFEIGRKLSERVVLLDTNRRRILHLAAVFANNFSNHMLVIAEKILERADLPVDWLDELVRETFEKAMDIGALNAQTGPAIRKDDPTINTHFELLHWDHQMAELYQYLTRSIQINDVTESTD